MRSGCRGIDVHQNLVGSKALRAVAGNGAAMIKMCVPHFEKVTVLPSARRTEMSPSLEIFSIVARSRLATCKCLSGAVN